MAVTRERFEQGMTYDAYKAQMTRNRERFEANERQVQVDASDLAAFQHLPQPLNVLVLAEDWCGDVIDNLPILGRIATESGRLNLRVFLRDQNLDLIDQYLNRGEFRSIPVFVFFDDQFKEIGRFIERPESVTQRRAEHRRALFAQHPEFGSPDTPITQLPEDVRANVMEAMSAARDETRTADRQDVIRELREIVERVPA
jgi:Thioredoxin